METKKIRPEGRVILVRVWPKGAKSTIDLDLAKAGGGCITSDLTPEQAYELVDFITENVKRPEPPKFVPQDGIYARHGSPYSKVYKFRDGAWRDAEGYVIVGRQDDLSEMARSGELVRLVKDGGDA